MNFSDLINKKELLKVIEELGYLTPTPIQEKIIPLIKNKEDLVGQSQTGTGKTLAFAASILDELQDSKKIQSLILAPTRELAIQIGREFETLSKYLNINTVCVYGNSSIDSQIREIKLGTEIIVGTPGRVKDLINRKVIDVNDLKYFVLDEADEMLSMGFKEELESIYKKTNKDKQVLLFSATMPSEIIELAKKMMKKDYKEVKIKNVTLTSGFVTQHFYTINEKMRLESLCRILDYYNPNRTIIFTRTKKNADNVYEKLTIKGYNVAVLHGDITQDERIDTLDKFKDGFYNYLIATDVASRGIHVDDIELVINYNIPETKEAYVHRIGRTGRASKNGLAITLIKPQEERLIADFEVYTKARIYRQELPTKKEILDNRSKYLLEVLEEIKNKSNRSKFNEFIEKLTQDEMKNILNNLLEKELTKSLGSDFTKDVEVDYNEKKERKRQAHLEDSIRVFITLGKLDNVRKAELLTFIENKANVKPGTCFNVEIMTKFTFMNIKNEYYNQVFKALNNTKYKNRLIKIEKAKK